MTLVARNNRLKRTSEVAMDTATGRLLLAERSFSEDPTPGRADNLKLCSRAIDQLLYEKSKRKLFFHRQKSFEHGERAWKLLAYLVHCEERPPVVISLRSPGNVLVTEPTQVTTLFQDFFIALYATKAPSDSTLMESFLDELPIPELTEAQMRELEAPLTKDEISKAIAEFPRYKAPGLDGLPVEFYSTYLDLLVSRLLTLYNSIFDESELPASMR